MILRQISIVISTNREHAGSPLRFSPDLIRPEMKNRQNKYLGNRNVRNTPSI